MATKQHSKRDVYQEVTDRIITALEAGTAPWVKPWATVGTSHLHPINGHTARAYNGINALLLWLAAQDKGYESHEWITFKQAKERGAHVRKGEKGTQVIFWRMIDKKAGGQVQTDENGQAVQIPMARFYTVFNRDQIEGLPELARTADKPLGEWQEFDQVEAAIQATGAEVRHGGSQAYYRRDQDYIQLPGKELFPTAPDYYATALHELTHWTGASRRLDRKKGSAFGDADYAFEELIAEMGAAFLCAHFGMEGRLEHENYIGSWIQVLKNDKRAVVRAASQAQKAADYILEASAEEETQAAA